ncbi:MAG: hypothetical protein ACXVHB_15125 [Solirubrobacteraceae bacterium]
MDAPTEHRTLIVANLTASTPFLLQEVSRLAAERPTKFSLLVPNVDPAKAADWSLETAEKLLSRAADSRVKGSLGGQDPLESIREAIAGGNYDDVLISTLPKPRSEWLRKGPADEGLGARHPGQRDHAAGGAQPAQAVHRSVLGQIVARAARGAS